MLETKLANLLVVSAVVNFAKAPLTAAQAPLAIARASHAGRECGAVIVGVSCEACGGKTER